MKKETKSTLMGMGTVIIAVVVANYAWDGFLKSRMLKAKPIPAETITEE